MLLYYMENKREAFHGNCWQRICKEFHLGNSHILKFYILYSLILYFPSPYIMDEQMHISSKLQEKTQSVIRFTYTHTHTYTYLHYDWQNVTNSMLMFLYTIARLFWYWFYWYAQTKSKFDYNIYTYIYTQRIYIHTHLKSFYPSVFQIGKTPTIMINRNSLCNSDNVQMSRNN